MGLLSSIRLENTNGANLDTRPLEPARRTFGPWEFVTLWVVTGSFNIGGWTTGSVLIALGLNVWQAVLTVIIGNILVGLLCVLSGAPGAKWHLSFAIIARSAWGVHGFRFVVIQRVFLACIWFSTQVYWGAQCVRVFLTALWPSFASLDTSLAHGTMTSGDMVSFVIFTVLYIPLIWVRPEKYRVMFLISCAAVIPTIFACLIWFTVKAQGAGPLVRDSSISGIPQAHGSHLGWMIVLGIVTNISAMSVHVYVQSDFTRYARKPRDQLLAQLIMVPMGTIIVAFIGITCTSCAVAIFPEETGTLLWEPYTLLSTLQSPYGHSPRSRVAVAFASLSFMVAQFGMVVVNNGVAAGLDLAALLPRYFNIRRGMLLMVVISFIVQPWELLNGASKFLSVLSGYGVFVGPMTGVMFADYFLVRGRRVRVSHLYEYSPNSIYWYSRGMNMRALVAWVMGSWLTVPGFVKFVQKGTEDPMPGWSNLYYISYLLGTAVTVVVYVALHYVWPMPAVVEVDDVEYSSTYEAGSGGRVLDGEEVGSTEVVPIEAKEKHSQA
ncbi:permease for cytosine/purines, uracil, thiamine, allantoin-domain-containing protein [Aspergillus carlsbadensis]|nr:permease for cytosine/purines, uracil, thiamine, allantoin-domain-containing protein [Aspergillus carlsbadensis]